MAVPFDERSDLIWFDGKLIPTAESKISVLTHGLHYASCVFEGERAYGGKIFQGTAHSERLKNSAKILDFEIPYSVAEIDAAKQLVLDKNNQKEAYVRPVAWRGSEALGVSAQQNRRPDPKTAPCLAKAAGLYMICTISKHRAEQRGYADAMMLDWQGRVAECTGANIFFVRDGKIHTPIADCFLAGITRATVIELAHRNNIEVIERRIMPDELAGFSECFITGTAAEVTAVSEIASWTFTPARITAQLMRDYTDTVQPKGNAAAA
jgi:branched-chain amino acid aminotransferase